MDSSIDQIIGKCRKCDQNISLRIGRIKNHFLKCPGPVIIYKDIECLEDHEKIGAVKRDIKGMKKTKKMMPYKTDFHEDSWGTGGPTKKYDYQTWREINDAKYLDKTLDYNKYPHKRYRSESDETNYSPEPKRFKESPRYWDESYNSEESSIEGEHHPIKRYRSGSSESDYLPESKKI